MARIEDTWIIIPLYNEEQMIARVVSEVKQTFTNVVCIDDGSTDGSVNAAEKAGALVIRHPMNLGQGAALQTGFDYVLSRTPARYVATFDADGQHQVSDVVAMRKAALDSDLAIVFGSRFLEGTPTDIPRLRRLVLRLAALFMRMTTGATLTDAHNGLRLLRRDALGYVKLRHNRMAHASEIVEQLISSGLTWQERPVHITYTDYSRSKGQSSLNSVNILVELLLG